MSRPLLVVVALVSVALISLGVHLLRVPPDGPPLAAFVGVTGLASPPPGAREGAWVYDALCEARRDGLLISVGAVLLAATALAVVAPHARPNLRTSVLFLLAYVAMLPLSGVLLAGGHVTTYEWLRPLQVFCAAVMGVNLVSVGLFDIGVPLTRVPSRPILRDLLTGLAYLVTTFVVLRSAGLPLKELLPAGAVATALVGLAVQSTLADVAGGLLLEWEDSIEVGDWIKIGDIKGKVREIRWRYTRVETKNWESVLFPNSLVTKQAVQVIGWMDDKPVQQRRWLYFTAGFQHAPADVIAVVNIALQTSPPERVAADPKPNCLFFDCREAGNYYAVRYWLTDLMATDSTDSAVRVRVHAALRRAGIELAVPSREVHMTVDDEPTRTRNAATTKELRVAALHRFDLFDGLTPEEMQRLAPHLSHAPFAKGEVMTRQGAEANWLYLLFKGEASVQVRSPSGETKVVSTLKAGDYFGEIALLTGEKRSATVVAETDCECWRLERSGFKEIVQARPEVASELSRIIAARRVGLEHTLAEAGAPKSLAAEERKVFLEISRFFGLTE